MTVQEKSLKTSVEGLSDWNKRLLANLEEDKIELERYRQEILLHDDKYRSKLIFALYGEGIKVLQELNGRDLTKVKVTELFTMLKDISQTIKNYAKQVDTAVQVNEFSLKPEEAKNLLKGLVNERKAENSVNTGDDSSAGQSEDTGREKSTP